MMAAKLLAFADWCAARGKQHRQRTIGLRGQGFTNGCDACARVAEEPLLSTSRERGRNGRLR